MYKNSYGFYEVELEDDDCQEEPQEFSKSSHTTEKNEKINEIQLTSANFNGSNQNSSIKLESDLYSEPLFVDSTNYSKDESDLDEFDREFIPPPKKRKRTSAPYQPKQISKPRAPKQPELPSNMEEVLTDPTRLPGGFKKGRYKVRSLTGVPYCKFCDTIFMNRKERQAHVCEFLQCLDAKNYICRVCKKELRKDSFSSHYHDAAVCQYCGKQYLNPRDIKEHIENAHKGEEFKPPVITNSQIDEYMQRKMQEEGHLYEKRARILARNLEHTGPKIYSCSTCSESFRNPRSLERHERIHSDREKFPCEFCGAIRFSKSNLLKHHQWVHKIPKLRENKKWKKKSDEDEKSKRDKIESDESEEDFEEIRKKVLEEPQNSTRTRKTVRRVIKKQISPSPPHDYPDYDLNSIKEEEIVDQIASTIEEMFDEPKNPITKIKSYLNAPLLPGNIKPGRYKIRNCTGVPFCKFCDTIFGNRKEKQKHKCEFLKCDPKNFICRVCKKELSRQSFSSHIHDTAGCQYCGKKILNPKDMKSHIAAKHRFEEYKPPLKIDESVVEEYLNEKLEKEAEVLKMREQKSSKNEVKRRDGMRFICDLCGEEEDTKKLIEFHIQSHVLKIYKCLNCDLTFDTKSAYAHHRIQHSIEIVTYHCDFCGKNFNSKENIRTHQKNIHGYGLKCEMCKVPLSGREEMICHMRSEHGEIPCKFCGKMFLIPSRLKAHEVRHMVQSEIKPSSKSYICQFCKESFYNSTALNYHLRFHGACDWFTCEFCGKNFPTAVNLKVHQARKHQIGISCEICKQSMQNKEELKEHMAVHGNFECSICSKSFLGPSKLKAHFRTHTKTEEEVDRVECSHCPRNFLPNRIRNHMFKFHKEKFDEWLASNNVTF